MRHGSLALRNATVLLSEVLIVLNTCRLDTPTTIKVYVNISVFRLNKARFVAIKAVASFFVRTGLLNSLTQCPSWPRKSLQTTTKSRAVNFTAFSYVTMSACVCDC